jgi:predicted Zn-dependent peptidase
MRNIPKTTTFENGLQLVRVPTDVPFKFRLDVVIRGGGSIHESYSTIGYAHFIEHLMSYFTSDKYPDADANQQELTTRGIFSNAITAEEYVLYFMEGLERDLEWMIDRVINNFLHPIIHDPTIYEQEKRAVLKELDTAKNQFWYALEMLVDSIIFQGTTQECDVSQEEQSIENVTVDKLRTFRQRLYTPEHTMIFVTSMFKNVSFEQVCHQVATMFDTQLVTPSPSSPSPKVYKCYELPFVPIQGPKCYFVKQNSSDESKSVRIEFFWYIPYLEDALEIQALRLCHFILTGAMGSRLYRALRTYKGLIYNVKSEILFNPVFQRANQFRIYTETKEDQLEKVFEILICEMKRFVRERKLTENEKRYCKNGLEISLINLKYETSLNKYLEEYFDTIVWGMDVHTPEEKYTTSKMYLANLDKLFDVVEKVFCPANLTVYYSGNRDLLKNKFHDHLQ